MVGVDATGGAGVAPLLQGEDPAPGLREGAASGEGVVPASGSPTARITLVLEAIVGVLQGVSVASPRLLSLQAGAQALTYFLHAGVSLPQAGNQEANYNEAKDQ